MRLWFRPLSFYHKYMLANVAVVFIFFRTAMLTLSTNYIWLPVSFLIFELMHMLLIKFFRKNYNSRAFTF